VPTFQASPVDGDGRLVGDHAAVNCGRSGTEQECGELPFFKSLCSA
jgi:hypothetical protein